MQGSSLQSRAAAEAEEGEDENPLLRSRLRRLPAWDDGSDANDPRAKLTRGLYDAGELSIGSSTLTAAQKPARFSWGPLIPTSEVQKMLGKLRVGNASKMPKP